jgi:hypothetical protein
MTTPTPRAEIAFTTPPTAAPSWTDVTPSVEAFSLRRGRQSPLESAGMGTATLRLANQDRRFDPTNAAGPYYGLLMSTRRLRIRADWNGTTYDLGHFYIDSWPLRRENYGHQYVDVTASDAFKVWNLPKLSASYAQQRSDQRIAAILTALNWTTGQGWVLGDATLGVLGASTVLGPVGDRALDQGVATVQAATLDRTAPLSHLQAVERTEFGFFFVGKNGAATFHNRNRRLLAGSTGIQATFGDSQAAIAAGSELPYADLESAYDDAELWNDVRVTRSGGTPQMATDATSQADHFPRALDWDTLAITDSEANVLAGYLRNRYSRQRLRITALILDPETPGDTVWPHLLSRDLGDVIRVRHTPLGGGARMEQVSFLEGISIDWQAEGNDWGRPVWQLSPADTTAYWVLGTSQLGTTTTLGI